SKKAFSGMGRTLHEVFRIREVRDHRTGGTVVALNPATDLRPRTCFWRVSSAFDTSRIKSGTSCIGMSLGKSAKRPPRDIAKKGEKKPSRLRCQLGSGPANRRNNVLV